MILLRMMSGAIPHRRILYHLRSAVVYGILSCKTIRISLHIAQCQGERTNLLLAESHWSSSGFLSSGPWEEVFNTKVVRSLSLQSLLSCSRSSKFVEPLIKAGFAALCRWLGVCFCSCLLSSSPLSRLWQHLCGHFLKQLWTSNILSFPRTQDSTVIVCWKLLVRCF